VLNGFGLGTLSICGQFRNKIIFYSVIEGAYVNTKNWYRKETDLWAEFGRRVLTVNSCIKVHLYLQADKSPIVVKGPFFPQVVNPRYRIRGTNV
jgi:hypothetical protein